jgi:hypothetical protein
MPQGRDHLKGVATIAGARDVAEAKRESVGQAAARL